MLLAALVVCCCIGMDRTRHRRAALSMAALEGVEGVLIVLVPEGLKLEEVAVELEVRFQVEAAVGLAMRAVEARVQMVCGRLEGA